MSVIGELVSSGTFYARERLITSRIVREKFERGIRFDDDLNLRWFGNDGRDYIDSSPLPPTLPYSPPKLQSFRVVKQRDIS